MPQIDFGVCMWTEPNDINGPRRLVGVARWKPDEGEEIPGAFAIPCPSKRAVPWLIKQILNELQWIDGIQKGELKLRIEKGQTVLKGDKRKSTVKNSAIGTRQKKTLRMSNDHGLFDRVPS